MASNKDKPKTKKSKKETPLAKPATRRSVKEWAERTKTSPIVFAGLKTEYGWNDTTTLPRTQFIELRQAWLKKEA